jgi:hypothetical protein
VPDLVARVRVAVAGGPCQQEAVDHELEQPLLAEVGQVQAGPLRPELRLQRRPKGRIVDRPSSPSDGEGVFVRLGCVRMHGEHAIPPKVLLLRRRDDEPVQAGVGDHRAHRVNPRATAQPDGAEVGQPDAVLVEQLPSGFCQVRSFVA